jgi:tetratricopeptide (TPR) repeat protein
VKSVSIQDVLTHIQQLISKGKLKEALDTVIKFEKDGIYSLIEGTSLLVLKGKIYIYFGQYKDAVKIGELAYQRSQKSEDVPNIIEALLIKAYTVFLGERKKSFDFITEVERIFTSRLNIPPYKYSRLKADFLLIKAIIFRIRGDIVKALEIAKKCKELLEKLGKKLEISKIYEVIGVIYLYKNVHDKALKYAKKSLAIQEELGNQIGIATNLSLLGLIYYSKGDLDEALKFSKSSLFIKEINTLAKIETLHVVGAVHREKGALDRTVRYYRRAAKLAEREAYIEEFISNIMGIGATYRMKGDLDLALTYLERSLKLSKQHNSQNGMRSSLFYLILINIDKNNHKETQQYLIKLEELADQTESIVFRQAYLIAKALFKRNKGRIRDRTEAEMLLKQITEGNIFNPYLYYLSMVNLCDLFLEELYITNNFEVLDELNPLINNISKMAEEQNAYLWLAETKLLQAKLALIQLKFEETQQLLTQAQRIAEIHGLSLLASKISNEHDNLLEQLNDWGNLQNLDAPMSERIKLASFNGVVDRMQGKRAIEIPKLVHEEPVLLLIIGEGGFPLFSTQFTQKHYLKEDLISGFLAAFNSFSSELFSKGLDRAKFGEHTILMQSAGIFSICYLFKGQTYLAKQKLTKFTENIQNTTYIWETLNKFYKNNQIIELRSHPPFGLLIAEIFINRSP